MEYDGKFVSAELAHRTGQIFAETAGKIALIKELLISSANKINSKGLEGSDISKNLAYRKILNDIIHILKTYSSAEKEMIEKGSFESLKESVLQGEIEQEAKKEYIALYHGRRWKQKLFEKGDRLNNVKTQIKTVDTEISEFCSGKNEIINNLREEINESNSANPQWQEYEKQLTEVSLENLKLRLDQKEETLTTKLMRLNLDVPKENKAHETMVYYLRKSSDDLITKKHFWDEKLSCDKKEMDIKINEWQSAIGEKQKDLAALQEEQNMLVHLCSMQSEMAKITNFSDFENQNLIILKLVHS